MSAVLLTTDSKFLESTIVTMPNNASNPALTPHFSIIIPTYNAANYIAQALDSVLAQTYPHWELIIVDDVSTDNTAEVVAPYLTNERIRYIVSPGFKQAAGPRNFGVTQAASFEWLCFMDADDAYEPEALQHYVDQITRYPESKVFSGAFREMNAMGEIISPINLNAIIEKPTWENLLKAQCHHQAQTVVVHRSIHEDIGGFREDILYVEDWAYYIELFAHPKSNMRYFPKLVFTYRRNPASISRNKKRALEVIDSFRTLGQWAKKSSMPDEAHQWISNFVAINYGYFTRMQWEERNYTLIPKACLRALQEPDIRLKDWFVHCFLVLFKEDWLRLKRRTQKVLGLFQKQVPLPA